MSLEISHPFEGKIKHQRQRQGPLIETKKTVLVVEADVALLEVIRYLLRLAGYEVLTAHTSTQAVSICIKSAVTLDLMLSDFNIPGGNGTDLAEMVSLLRPGLPMIFITGNQKASETLQTKGCFILEKPFSFAEMTCLVCEILGGATDVPMFSKAFAKSSME